MSMGSFIAKFPTFYPTTEQSVTYFNIKADNYLNIELSVQLNKIDEQEYLARITM